MENKSNSSAVTKLYPVIMSGGSGTRLWPLSRASYPKQFLKLSSDKTLLQETILRINDEALFHAPLIVSNTEHRFIVAEQLRSLNIQALDILLEPIARNTAPAILAAALRLTAEDPEALMLVLPSDHVMSNMGPFLSCLQEAARIAASEHFVTFGIKASKPETGYGYLLQGKLLQDSKIIYKLQTFVEKPNRDKAEEFLAAGNYSWNSGMFLLCAKHVIKEMTELYPETVKACQQALQLAKKDLDFLHLESVAFAQCINQSIDYALLEKTKQIAMVALDCHWNDIGSWSALWEQNEHDAEGNVVKGDVLLDEVNNSYIHSEGPLVTVLGLDNILVVVTPDAILIASKDKDQQLKNIIQKLQLQKRQELLTHPVVTRPWGSYQVIDSGKNFQAKRIIVKPGHKISLQKHQHRSEHWVVVKGVAVVTKGEEEFSLHQNESTYIPVGMIHRLVNLESTDLEIIEVQSGDYLGEDDIIRLDDIYNRSTEDLTKDRVFYV
jgi:mannose-1-phosphate guanylyltransferase/mannose-6-phosphate isomerase